MAESHAPSMKIAEALKGMTIGRKIALLATLSITLAAFAVMFLWTGGADYQLLYSNLSPEDAAAVVSKLKERKVPYEILAGGTAITVPADRLYEVRLELAAEGLPQGGGVGFEIFDQTKLGATEFVEKINYRRALQGELARTIAQFKEVQSARVHLVIPERSLFIEERQKATASVVLKLKAGRKLNKNQVQGIIHLVSSSVEGLEPSEVSVVDTEGHILSAPMDDETGIGLSSSQLEYRQSLERELEKRIESMLEQVLGPGKALARVSANINFKRIEKIEERFDPEATTVRSEQRSEERQQGANPAVSGVPGVVSNLPQGGAQSVATVSQNSSRKTTETINYEVSKVTRKILEPVGTLENLSVAVLLDGTYQKTVGKDGKESLTYKPRSDEELKKFEEIVKTAVGFNAARGDQVVIKNVPFERISPLEEEEGMVQGGPFPMKYIPLIKYLIALVISLLFVFVILKPLVKALTAGGPSGALQSEEGSPQPALGEPAGHRVAALEAPAGPRRDLIELANKEPDQFAGVIRNWLK